MGKIYLKEKQLLDYSTLCERINGVFLQKTYWDIVLRERGIFAVDGNGKSILVEIPLWQMEKHVYAYF